MVSHPYRCMSHLQGRPLPENPTYIASEDYCTDYRRWRGIQRCRSFVTRRQAQRNSHYHGGGDAWPSSGPRQPGRPECIRVLTVLLYTLACFEDQKVGGVGTSQRVRPVGNHLTVWEVLAAFRLTIRNIEISSANHIDGGIPCLWSHCSLPLYHSQGS
jgi:hypothetical protein